MIPSDDGWHFPFYKVIYDSTWQIVDRIWAPWHVNENSLHNTPYNHRLVESTGMWSRVYNKGTHYQNDNDNKCVHRAVENS